MRIERAQQPRLVKRMWGSTRFSASSVTKNATSIALSCPQKRTARRVASNARLLLGKLSARLLWGKLSAIVVLSKPSTPPAIAQPTMTIRPARRALQLSGQPCRIFAVRQNNGGHAEAGGRSQCEAE